MCSRFTSPHGLRGPWYAKAPAVAGKALCPLDLIPDFIPVPGYLDDVIVVPAVILLVRKMIAPELFVEHRAGAATAETPCQR